jgi:hypothetical protein
MKGAEHYQEAERLLRIAVEHRDTGDRRDHQLAAQFTAEAQVHATLALAAATARPAVKEWIGDELRDGADWTRVTS